LHKVRTIIAWIAASATTIVLASVAYTWDVLEKQKAIGVAYSAAEEKETYLLNLVGLAPAYGGVLAASLALGFLVAFGAKRLIRPLAPVAYPIAGAAGVVAAIALIETLMAPGRAGAIGGARDALGLALQAAAGAAGGFVFAALRPKGR